MKTRLVLFLKWLVAILLFFASLGVLVNGGLLSSVSYLSIGLLILPALNLKRRIALLNNNWVYGGAIVALLVLSTVFAPSRNTDKGQGYSTAKANKDNKEKIIDTIVEYRSAPTISITHINTKKIDGDYRYFFNIKNTNDVDFNGDIQIKLYNTLDNSFMGDRFENIQIKSHGGTFVYIDASTGPPSVHAEYGAKKFLFDVENDDFEQHGTGEILDIVNY